MRQASARQQRLWDILARVGAERVTQGFAAFDDPTPEGHSGNFMARCYGAKYQLVRAWILENTHEGWVSFAARRLRLPPPDVYYLSVTFEKHRRQMRRDVLAWLQARAATA